MIGKINGNFKKVRSFGGFVAAIALFAIVGCEVHSSGVTERVRLTTTRIDDADLEAVGLTSLEFLPPDPTENPVVNVTLLEEDLFTSTQPRRKRAGLLRRIDRNDLTTKWSYKLELPEPIKHAPSAYKYAVKSRETPDELFVSLLDTVYVVDLEWGDLLDKMELDFPVSTPIVASDEFVFVGSDNERIYGIRKGAGVPAWRHRTRGSVLAAPASTGAGVALGSTDGYVYHLSQARGFVSTTSWKFKTGAAVLAAPVPYGQWLLVGSTDYKLYCLSLRNGSPAWSFPAEAPIEEAPVIYSERPGKDHVYVVSARRARSGVVRTLFSVNLSNGQMRWRKEGVRRVVSMGKKVLYVVTDPESGKGRNLLGLDIATGEEQFSLDISNFAYVPTNHANFGRDAAQRGKIYLCGADGAVQLLGERF